MSEEPSAEAFFETLSTANGSYAAGYEGRIAKYQDFRAVFYGSERGTRVLHEILRQCGVNTAIPPVRPVDPYVTHIREGRRGAGLTIMGILNDEPREQPTEATRKDKT